MTNDFVQQIKCLVSGPVSVSIPFDHANDCPIISNVFPQNDTGIFQIFYSIESKREK